MSKDVLQITITSQKAPTTKLGKWMYWKIYFPVWRIWRPKMISKFCWAMSNLILTILPKAEREKLLSEYEDITVVIKDETNKK